MKGQLPELILFQKIAKMVCNVIGRVGSSKLVHIYIFAVMIAVPTKPSILFLLVFHLEQHLFDLRHQRQASAACFVLSAVFRYDFEFPINFYLNNRVVNCYTITFKINGFPTISLLRSP